MDGSRKGDLDNGEASSQVVAEENGQNEEPKDQEGNDGIDDGEERTDSSRDEGVDENGS